MITLKNSMALANDLMTKAERRQAKTQLKTVNVHRIATRSVHSVLIDTMKAKGWTYEDGFKYKDNQILRFEMFMQWGDLMVANVIVPPTNSRIDAAIEQSITHCDVYDINGDLALEQANCKYLDYAFAL